MDKKDIGIIIVLVLAVAGWIGWVVTHYEQSEAGSPTAQMESESPAGEPRQEVSAAPSSAQGEAPQPAPPVSVGPVPEGGFPPPTVEVVNGRPERTIHMGVRQYAWDPSVITAKQGELVRLIVHNADVKHGLVIPELNVLNIDIPPEGAVIEFEASKAGTFVFFCSYYCGEGHSEMRGKIIVE